MTTPVVSRVRSGLRRGVAFGSVGTLGFALQFVSLLMLAGVLGVDYLVATAIAVELAILHNFLWHQHWTWSDRGVVGRVAVVRRLLSFNAGTGVTSIGGNLLIMWCLVSGFGLHFAVANVLSVLSLSLINFVFCDRMIFGQPAHRCADSGRG